MSDFEQQLRRRLTGNAEAVAPRADLEELVERIADDRVRHRRLTAFGMALLLIAGPIAGFGVARASTGSPAAAPRLHRTRSASAFSATKLPTVSTGATTATTIPPPGQLSRQGDGIAIYGPVAGLTLAAYPDLALGRMFARTSNDGITLRAYGARLPQQTQTVPWFTPAPWCFPDRLVQVDTSDDLVAGTTQAYVYPQAKGGVGASVQMLGTAEGAPLWVAVVQSDKGTSARVTFSDGGSDAAPLDHGVAVLSHRTGAAAAKTPTAQSLTVQILDAGGAVVAHTETAPQSTGPFLSIGNRDSSECIAPTKLPAAGSEQPSDVAAATAAVKQAFADAYNSQNSSAVREAAIDDPTGLDAVYAKLAAGSFAQQVKDARAQVDQVVFLSATKAAVAYDIVVPNYSNFTGRLGEAVFVDGRWKVSRTTVCNDISLAAVTCSP